LRTRNPISRLLIPFKLPKFKAGASATCHNGNNCAKRWEAFFLPTRRDKGVE
jgi:hypothetical protein